VAKQQIPFDFAPGKLSRDTATLGMTMFDKYSCCTNTKEFEGLFGSAEIRRC
jgi:hypothetical protein